MDNVVIIKNEDCFVGTWDLSKGFEIEHRAITKLIKKYKSEFEELGVVASPVQQPSGKKGGRKIVEYFLDEPQTTYLTTLLTNNSIVRAYKMKLTKMFFDQRKFIARLISQKQNQEWLLKRESGKIERRLETDTIKKFVEYAKSQGSQNADKYYMIITKMENNSLFALDFLGQKFPNLRDIIDHCGLNAMESADRVVGQALKEGMEQSIPYKECYQLARDRVENFSRLIGKTPLKLVLEKNKQKLLTIRS
jgi:phage regulator Rha-like protein